MDERMLVEDEGSGVDGWRDQSVGTQQGDWGGGETKTEMVI